MSKESTIRTKFQVGDSVWRIRNMRAEQTNVCQLDIRITSKGTEVVHFINNATGKVSIKEENIFATKQELLESL